MRKANPKGSMIPYAVTEWTGVIDRSPPHSSTLDSNFGQIPMGHDMSGKYCGTAGLLPLYVDTIEQHFLSCTLQGIRIASFLNNRVGEKDSSL